jgi:hypothetical protein
MEYFFYKSSKLGFLFSAKVDVKKFLSKGEIIAGPLSEVVHEIASRSTVNSLIYSSNESIVITERLFKRLSTIDELFKSANCVAIFSSVITSDGLNKSCVYAQNKPKLPDFGEYSNVSNASYDLCAIKIKDIYRIIRGIPAWIDHSFNAILINQIYKKDFTVKYSNELIVGCKDVAEPNDTLAINEILKSKNLLSMKKYITFQGIEKIVMEDAQIPDDIKQRKKLKYSIIMRTQFNRIELLKRALSSIFLAKSKMGDKIQLEIILVSDNYKNYPKEIREIEKILNIVKVRTLPTLIPNRTQNIISGVRKSTGDYLSFLDDDDYLHQDYFQSIDKKLQSCNPEILFFSCTVNRETLKITNKNLEILREEKLLTYEAKDSLKFFKGVNMTPICGFAVDRTVLLNFINKGLLKYDLSEDYTLLLGIMGSVCTIEVINKVLCFISVRDDGENTVTQIDRTQWLGNISDHLSMLLSDKQIFKNLNFINILSEANNVSDKQKKYEIAYKKLVESL